MVLFMTGGTGFIGKELVYTLSPHFSKIYLVIRKKSLPKAQILFSKIKNVHLLEGDITETQIFTHDNDLKKVVNEVDVFIHAAAIYDLSASKSSSYFTNVVGTQNILSLAKACKNLKYYHHLSTIVVSGNYAGTFKEDQIPKYPKFLNHYAHTKYISEMLTRSIDFKNVKKRIYRPGIVIGNSTTGEFDRIDGPYYFIRLLAKNKKTVENISKRLPFFPFPFNPKTTFPVIPIDQLTIWLTEMISSPKGNADLRCYHLTPKKMITISTFINACLKEIGVKARLLPMPNIPRLWKPIFGAINLPKDILPYLYSQSKYDVSQRMEDYPDLIEIPFSKYKKNLLRYAFSRFSKVKR